MLFVHVATTNWRTPLLEILFLPLYNLNGSQKIFAIPTEFVISLALRMLMPNIRDIWGPFGFTISITQFSVFIIHNSKMIGPITKRLFGKR